MAVASSRPSLIIGIIVVAVFITAYASHTLLLSPHATSSVKRQQPITDGHTDHHHTHPATRQTQSAVVQKEEPRVIVLTYASHVAFKFCYLLESAVQFHMPIVILGYNEAAGGANPKEKPKNFNGLGHKLLATREFIRLLEPDDIILFVDAFDVILTKDLEDFSRTFRSFNTSLVFSAEKGCWPYLDGRPHANELCLQFYPDSPTMYRFVNTGSWIGTAAAAANLFDGIISYHTSTMANLNEADKRQAVGALNDQELITDYFVCDSLNALYAAGGQAAVDARIAPLTVKEVIGCTLTGEVKYNISLDYQCRMFQSLHNSEVDQRIFAQQRMDVHVTFDKSIKRWRNHNTNTVPGVFHFNGGGKAHADIIWQEARKGHRRLKPSDYDTFIQLYDIVTRKYSAFNWEATCKDAVGTVQ